MGAIVSVRMYSHTIVYFYIRTSENLVNVGSSRHKLPRHLQCSVGDTDPSGQNWSDMSCRADMSRYVGDISSEDFLSPYTYMGTVSDIRSRKKDDIVGTSNYSWLYDFPLS